MILTGLFGGTFNPVHNGHIALAKWLIESGTFDEVWLTLSPQNPLKSAHPGASDSDRKLMLQAACTGIPGLHPCFVEFDMPRPSYTIDTLRHLAAEYPDRSFNLIIGSDNWTIFNKWRAPEEIIRDFGVTVYPRPGYDITGSGLPDGVRFVADAPVCNISSTEIRKNPELHLTMLPPSVAKYIKAHKLYEST